MTMQMRRYEGKSVLVTGGSTGVGYETAKRYAQEGASVVITGRRGEAGQQAVELLKTEGLHSIEFLQGDVSDEDSVKSVISRVIEKNGKLDILVNNAATFYPVRFLDADRSKWKKVFDIIVDGTYFCSQEAARHMVKQGVKGHIINVSSINSHRALEESTHYNAAKGAMNQLTKGMALELIDYGIKVNGLNLGFIDTPMSVVDGENELDSDWFKQIYVENKKLPMKRAAHPKEVASVIAFLTSEDASYLCGAIIPVDGGLSITF